MIQAADQLFQHELLLLPETVASPTPERSPEPSPEASSSTPPVAIRPSPQSAPARGLSGFGATDAEWERNHARASGYNPGSAYLPLVQDEQPRYAVVQHDDRITSYAYFFDYETTLQSAMAEILRNEFRASEAKYGRIDRGESTCVIAEIRSSAVEKVLTPGYRAAVAFFSEPSDEPFQASDVDNAQLLTVEAGTSPDLGDC